MIKYLSTLTPVEETEAGAHNMHNAFIIACANGNLNVVKFLATELRLDVHLCVGGGLPPPRSCVGMPRPSPSP